MSAEIELQEHERLEDQNAAWSGEPVTLTVPPWGGNPYRGLASTVHFPADGVHRVRRQAALEVKAASGSVPSSMRSWPLVGLSASNW